MTMTAIAISTLRDRRYHRTPEGRIHTEAAARAFVDEVGFCFLFGERGIEIPTLWGAICGADRPVPRHHDDADLGRAWNWKDSLPARGEVFYGKLLRAKPTLVSLALLPTFYALSPNYGDVEDYLQQYDEGLLTIEARNIYQALRDEGPLSTSRLRQIAGLQGGGPVARRFDNALTELQTQLKIAKTGISDANRWGYAYVYDLFLRAFPDVPEQARLVSTDRAMETLLLQHLHNTVAEREAALRRLFGWEGWEMDRTLARLVTAGTIEPDVQVVGERSTLVVATATLRELEALA
jgi:hypothetical protein